MSPSMLLVGLLLFLLGQGAASAQETPAGDPKAGKTLWDSVSLECRYCHGFVGEGAFGPDLAGRGLTVAQFRQAVRKPWGIMPAFVEEQISDREIADLAAYFDSLGSVSQPGKWRRELVPGSARGLEAVTTVGCIQCHPPTLQNQRTQMGAVSADFEWFKDMVYNHSTALPRHRILLGDKLPARVAMGNFSPTRVPEVVLQEIWTYLRDQGFRAPVAARLSPGVASGNGMTYTLDVENFGIREKGLTAEDLTVTLIVPAAAKVVSATGAGYEGVRRDESAKGDVAVWRIPRLTPKDRQTYTITLSQAGTASDNLRGSVSWARPAVKPGPGDSAAIPPAPPAEKGADVVHP